MDSFNAVSVFVACVERGGFANAGRKLGISRSAVGKTVARLETELGVRLFQRTTRSLRLTDDGQIYFESARRALSELETARAAIAQGRCEPVGRLRVTAPVTFGRLCVAPVLLGLAHKNPGLELTMSFSDRPAQLVEDGYDLAVRVSHSAEGSGLVVRKLATFEMILCASPAYLEARGVPVSTADLERHDRVVFLRSGGSAVWRLPDNLAGWTEFDGGASRICMDNLEAAADAAAGGHGIAWLPNWLVDNQIEAGRLTRLWPEVNGQTHDVSALWPRSPFMPSRLRMAIDALAERLPAAQRRRGTDRTS